MERLGGSAVLIAIALVSAPALTSVPVAASIEEGPLDAEEQLNLGDGDHIELDAEGTGWGRLALTSNEAIEVNVSVEHETIEYFGLGTDDGESIYDGDHYTFAYAFDPDEKQADFHDEAAWTFEWWGFADTSSWAIGNTQATLELSPDQPIVVLLATNVEGYTLHLNASTTANEASADRAWQLLKHPELEINWPTPEHTATASHDNAGVEETWQWDQQRNLSSDALVKLQWWQRFDKPTVIAGNEELDWAVYRESQGLPEQDCDPSASIPSLPSIPPGAISFPGMGTLTSCLPSILLSVKSPYQAPCDPSEPLTETRCCYVVDRTVEVPPEGLPNETIPERDAGPVRACPYLGTSTDWRTMTNTTYRPAMDDPIVWDVTFDRTWAGADNTGFGAGFATIPLGR